jgi:hypothetical protein
LADHARWAIAAAIHAGFSTVDNAVRTGRRNAPLLQADVAHAVRVGLATEREPTRLARAATIHVRFVLVREPITAGSWHVYRPARTGAGRTAVG